MNSKNEMIIKRCRERERERECSSWMIMMKQEKNGDHHLMRRRRFMRVLRWGRRKWENSSREILISPLRWWEVTKIKVNKNSNVTTDPLDEGRVRYAKNYIRRITIMRIVGNEMMRMMTTIHIVTIIILWSDQSWMLSSDTILITRMRFIFWREFFLQIPFVFILLLMIMWILMMPEAHK